MSFVDLANLPAQEELQVSLPLPSVGEYLQADYATVGTTLGPHPLGLLRGQLSARRCRSSRELVAVEHGRNVSVAGLVVGRQRPQTASGVIFVTLEDEYGMVNVVSGTTSPSASAGYWSNRNCSRWMVTWSPRMACAT